MDNVLGLLMAAWVIGAWLTHVVVSIQTAKWLLLIAGAIVFPVGCVHGTGIWMGWF